MIVCFGALAGIYVLLGAPLVAGAQVLVYIRAISVLVLFAIMLTPDQERSGSLVFQTQAVPAAIRLDHPGRDPRPRRVGDRLGRGRRPDRDGHGRHGGCS